MTLEDVQELQLYHDKNRDRYLNELIEFLKIPSISADPKRKADVKKTAEFLRDKLKEAGAEHVELLETGGHPIVFGEKKSDPSAPTILVYGHYDVQPPDPLELWDSGPFDPVIKDEKIYARGACDDKGQVYMHVKAFEAMAQNGGLACNVKFMIEGEEEVGSEHLSEFCRANRDKLAADVILISDTSMIANDVPCITVGLRGLAYLEVEVRGPSRDLHSGVYGGGVANPLNVLCQMIASLQNKEGKITIPGFYDDVVEISEVDRELLNQAPFDLEKYKLDLGISEVHGEEGYTTLERVSIRPSLDVNGIWGGYTGEGAKTVLPARARAKISMRLVPDQDSQKIAELFADHMRNIAPPTVKVSVRRHHGGQPVVVQTDSIEYMAAHEAMKATFDQEPIPIRSGGSIPIVALFEEILDTKSVLMGFGLDSDAIHSPNEHFGLFNFYKGIETIPYFHYYYRKLKAE
jgi:acetylornithine deacetylase/succinyl-diaminopimelate desuccinylase-like protein